MQLTEDRLAATPVGGVELWERAPIPGARSGTAALSEGGDFERKVAQLEGRRVGREEAIQRLANSGAIAF